MVVISTACYWLAGPAKQATQPVASGSPQPKVQPQPQPQAYEGPADNKSVELRLKPGESAAMSHASGCKLSLMARIDYPKTAGAAFLLEILADGRPLDRLTNKSKTFVYPDGREFPFRNSAGTWNIFYSPDFEQNEDPSNPYHPRSVGNRSANDCPAYRYEWLLPTTASGQTELRFRHVLVHEGQKINHPLMMRVNLH